MTWHVEPTLLRRYLDGAVDLEALRSIEAHIDGCAACRGLVPVAQDWLDASWDATVAEVQVPRRGFVERLLVRSGVGPPLARLLVAAPSSRRSWWMAVLGALTFAVTASHAAVGDDASLLLFLALAPVLPVSGVAVAYGPRVDPLYELLVAAPIGGLRLLLIRTAVVLTATVGIGVLAVPLLPAVSWTAVGWLVPALALTAAAVALGSWLPQLWASGIVTGVWVAVVALVAVPAHDPLVLFRAEAQPWFGLLVAVGGLVVVTRRRSFDVGGRR